MSEENRAATLNDLYARIDKNKYAIELKFDPVATTANVNSTPTYSIVNKIGSMYYFTVDSKLVITDVETREPKVSYITFSDITWNEGKASITLSTKEQGTIEYKVGEDGVYAPGTTISNLSHGDTVYARINNNGEYTEEETKVIYDGIKPEEFSITTSDLTYNSVKLTTTGTTDNQTGLASYTYVAENNGTIVQEIPNQTVTEYPITGLEEQTEYVVYMLAYDNAGNVRKSNEVTVTTTQYVPPQASAPSTGNGTYREGNQLPFTWAQLAEIAEAISNNSNVTSNTNELTITYEGTAYTIGVGDYTYINSNKVRILGFNHDILSGYSETVNEDSSITVNSYSNIYGGQNKYAGISFEYVDFLIEGGDDAKMNITSTNTDGWAGSKMYTTLNTTQYNSLPDEVKGVIKQVKKAYCKEYDKATISYSDDKLWLLSCAEMWSTGYESTGKGFSMGTEGSQYKYYKNINAIYISDNNFLKKPSSVAGTSSSGTIWWLRSTGCYYGGTFCLVKAKR